MGHFVNSLRVLVSGVTLALIGFAGVAHLYFRWRLDIRPLSPSAMVAILIAGILLNVAGRFVWRAPPPSDDYADWRRT